jgi:hypothetical protein
VYNVCSEWDAFPTFKTITTHFIQKETHLGMSHEKLLIFGGGNYETHEKLSPT